MDERKKLPSKHAVRDLMGRGLWTVGDYAARRGVAIGTARRHVRDLQAGGVVVLEGSRPLRGEDGRPCRGRPVKLYRVPIGQNR